VGLPEDLGDGIHDVRGENGDALLASRLGRHRRGVDRLAYRDGDRSRFGRRWPRGHALSVPTNATGTTGAEARRAMNATPPWALPSSWPGPSARVPSGKMADELTGLQQRGRGA
jgi:hypothetical protein